MTDNDKLYKLIADISKIEIPVFESYFGQNLGEVLEEELDSLKKFSKLLAKYTNKLTEGGKNV
jgi:hypothetical protein